ncbi:unnamed protein product [Soboliphyme baturini]|uniref:Death domain-containing protein n=1 Tax=Soboliphyme baturini TaxID=241478 RepID=A0A183IZZ5_9BILA|nr:unnamed protein product [Soboliphyme baturini]
MGQTAKDYLEDQQLLKVLRHQHHRLSPGESKNIHSCIGLWLRDGCLAKLEQLILSGCGDLLTGRQSSNPLSQKFLQEVPQYLVILQFSTHPLITRL